jgi:pimeloyl-ACP methyl ester carboxylesterase
MSRLSRRRLLAASLATGTAFAVRRPFAGAAWPTGATQTTGDFSGLVDIGGRSLYLMERGIGGPTVILESGFGNNADIWDTIALAPDSGEMAVLPGVAAFTSVCAYDRPGTVLDADHLSRSDPVPMPRTAADAVADLHALLAAADVPGPYVLVGHSFGGIVVRLFAATYPDQVVGLVLVDAADEEMHDRLRAALTPEQWAAYAHLNNQVPPDLADYPDLERVDLDTSFAQLQEAAATHPLPPLPLVVLSRGRAPFDAESPEVRAAFPPGFPIDVFEPAWQAGQAELAALVPGARHVVATKSAHWIQLDEPGLVIEAVRQVADAVRDPSSWTT